MEELTVTIARERVARGAALLDRKRPGWFERIDVGTLKLSSCTHCVLGQLWVSEDKSSRDFSRALQELQLETSEPRLHGFAAHDGGFSLLQDAWIEAIAARLHLVVEDEDQITVVEAVECQPVLV